MSLLKSLARHCWHKLPLGKSEIFSSIAFVLAFGEGSRKSTDVNSVNHPCLRIVSKPDEELQDYTNVTGKHLNSVCCLSSVG